MNLSQFVGVSSLMESVFGGKLLRFYRTSCQIRHNRNLTTQAVSGLVLKPMYEIQGRRISCEIEGVLCSRFGGTIGNCLASFVF